MGIITLPNGAQMDEGPTIAQRIQNARDLKAMHEREIAKLDRLIESLERPLAKA